MPGAQETNVNAMCRGSIVMRMSGHVVLAALVVAGAASPLFAHSEPPEKIALTGGRIIPVVGEEIEKGTILIERGKITAIGETVEIPYDAMEIDVTGKVLMPGMIDPHSARGLDIRNENLPVTPFLDAYDAIDPSKSFFEDSLRNGVTSVHVIVANNCVIGGVSRVVRPIGLTVNEMTVQPDLALKLSTTPKSGFDRMRQMASLRETFLELDDYLEKLAEKMYEEKLKKEDKTIDVGPAEARERGRALITDQDYDDKHANLVRLRRGDLAGWVYVGAPTDVAPAIALAEEQGFLDRTVLVLGPQTYRAIGELTRAGRPVVLDANLVYRDRDPLTGDIEEIFIPSKLYDAGLTFALQPNPNASMAERFLNYQAALCVRNGIPRQTALEAITINPAKMLGLEDRLGSLEVGKAGNIVVLSGDPLDFSSWVEHVYIDGILAYDRDRDPRLQKLLDLERRVLAAQADDTVDDETAEGEEAEDQTDAEDASDEDEGDDDGEDDG